jgi:hypothetical protein
MKCYKRFILKYFKYRIFYIHQKHLMQNKLGHCEFDFTPKRDHTFPGGEVKIPHFLIALTPGLVSEELTLTSPQAPPPLVLPPLCHHPYLSSLSS